jgi:hypothetical protein
MPDNTKFRKNIPVKFNSPPPNVGSARTIKLPTMTLSKKNKNRNNDKKRR